MEIFALSKNVKVGPRKLRLIADVVRGNTAAVAMNKLQFLAKSGSVPVLKAVKSAVANATNNLKLKAEDLKVKNILIDEGIKMKRRDTSHGARFGGGVITKKASHITVILSDTGNEPSRSLAHSQAHGQ